MKGAHFSNSIVLLVKELIGNNKNIKKINDRDETGYHTNNIP